MSELTCFKAYDVRGEIGVNIDEGTRRMISNINFLTMHFANWLPTSMTIVRASLTHARTMTEYRSRQDFIYWLNIFKYNNIRCQVLPTILGTYQQSTNSVSSNKLANVKSNFMVFRNAMKYNWFLSCLCVFINILVRIVRV